PSPLKQLSNFISDNVDVVDDRCKALGHEYPSLHEPFNPFNPAEALTRDPVTVQNIIVIVAAADQLIATARLPINTTADLAFGFHTYSALQAVTTASIPEILREVGPHGTHSKDIATKTYLDADKIFRFLRLLVTHHVFRELEPDVWTSNRPSSMLDTGKSVEELSAKMHHTGLSHKYWIFECCLQGLCINGEILRNPQLKGSDDLVNAPLIRAFGAQKPFFEWLETDSQNDYRRKRSGAAMVDVNTLNNPRNIFKESLKRDATLVDVGGGLGSVSLKISNQFPTFNIIVQDLPMVLEQAKGYWKENNPSASIRKSYDFLKPQTIKDADLFLLRLITHDWPDSYLIKILQQLRAAAVP
ncbi:hypothetical protein M422DRAFT_99910, partial [Sphaerobolus stellatus SS14]